MTTTKTTTKTVTLMSRHANYRWRDVQFENFTAQVSEARFEEMKGDRYFGPGRDFWVAADAPAGGGKNDAPPPADPPQDLHKLKKDELVSLAAERGVELTGQENKAEIVEKLEAAAD